MNRILAFQDARGFQEIFGIREHDNGVKSRRNSILLSYYKSKSVWDYSKRRNLDLLLLNIRDMNSLHNIVMSVICDEMTNFNYTVELMGRYYRSNVFETDECRGLPSNGAIGFVRYITHEQNRDGKIYRMRAGRFFKRLILETKFGRALPVQVVNWLCEQFTEQWSSYVTRKRPNFTLKVDDDFRRIYSYDEDEGCTYDFGSCMMDDDQYIFYRECVKAKAAYLENEDGRIIARCVIFTEAHDQNGKVWRLAERQYAEEGRDFLKRCLVDALIDGGYIDAYKRVGVDCHKTTAYVDIEGNSLQHLKFSIECKLEFSQNPDDAWDSGKCHILSYQDSFKYFDPYKKIAYNSEPDDYSNIFMLDTTNCYLEGNWDDYHECWCRDYYWVWKDGEEMRCDCNRLEDFINYTGHYIHKNDFVECPVCGNKMPNDKYEGYSFTFSYHGTRVCSRDCRIKLQTKHREEHCFYDNVRGCYVEKSEEKEVKILQLAFGKVNILSCGEQFFKSAISSNQSHIFKMIDGEKFCVEGVVPMYVHGLVNPLSRIDRYIEQGMEMDIALISRQIIQHNAENGIEKLYEEKATI